MPAETSLAVRSFHRRVRNFLQQVVVNELPPIEIVETHLAHPKLVCRVSGVAWIFTSTIAGETGGFSGDRSVLTMKRPPQSMMGCWGYIAGALERAVLRILVLHYDFDAFDRHVVS